MNGDILLNIRHHCRKEIHHQTDIHFCEKNLDYFILKRIRILTIKYFEIREKSAYNRNMKMTKKV